MKIFLSRKLSDIRDFVLRKSKKSLNEEMAISIIGNADDIKIRLQHMSYLQKTGKIMDGIYYIGSSFNNQSEFLGK